jgi:hypothetical protein
LVSLIPEHRKAANGHEREEYCERFGLLPSRDIARDKRKIVGG